ncbi:hypothetical protein PROFUN_16549 [Planoprotostelium fungivorum]|uniref:Uncharacterized protein n=1 Tax=Planoprotostelium fungivorum TaxID=1890364 RepID=A0A2P6MQD6_9EUKA|nr:hypothetical protein PROFUN_16549 [Planoprotostelium fungivorum]
MKLTARAFGPRKLSLPHFYQDGKRTGEHTGGVTACTTCKLIESAKTLNSAGSLFPAFVAQVFIQGRRHSK